MNNSLDAHTPHTTSSLAVFSLVFGILSWFCLPLLGAVVAIVCGHRARGEIQRAPPGTLEGDGLARGGLVLGYAHLIACVLAILVFVFVAGLGVTLAHLH